MARCHRVLLPASCSGGVVVCTSVLQGGGRPILLVRTALPGCRPGAGGAKVEGDADGVFSLGYSVLYSRLDVLVRMSGRSCLVSAR